MATRRAQPDIVPDENTAKAPKATKAKVEKAPREVDADGNPVKRSRTVRGDRNHLARSIDTVLRSQEGPITVSEIVAAITYADESHPSSGAVAAALKRWSEQGYITINPKPLAFKSFQSKAKGATLDAFLEKSREDRLAARRAAKAA